MVTDVSPGVATSVIRYWWLVVATVLLGLIGAAALSGRQDTVVPAVGRVVLDDWRSYNLVGSEVVRATYTRIGDESIRASSVEVVDSAAAILGIPAEELRRTSKVDTETGTNAIRFSSASSTADDSVSRVNAQIDAYVSAVDAVFAAEAAALLAQLETQRVGIAESIRNARAQLATMAVDDPGRSDLLRSITLKGDETDALNRRSALITAANDSFDGGVLLVAKATGPSGPAEPNTRRNVALGGAIGLLFGIAGAWSLADTRQRRSASAESVTRIQVGSSRAAAAQEIASSPESDRAQPYRLALAHAAAAARATSSDGMIVAIAGSQRDAHVHEHAAALCASAAADGLRVLQLNGREAGGSASLIEQLGESGPIDGVRTVALASGVTYDSLLVGGTSGGSTRALRSPEFSLRLKQVVAPYDLVVWSLPGIQQGAALASILHADSLLLTIPRQQRPPAEAAALIASTGIPFAGYIDYRRRSGRRRARS